MLEEYSKLVPVGEHRGLYRDARNNSIVNNDTQAYENALRAKQARRALNDNVSFLKNKVSALEERIYRLEQIIKANNK